jgi:hypothetical protein
MKAKLTPPPVFRQNVPLDELRKMMTLPECADEAGVSRRFLEKEICRGRLRAIKPSSRVCRVRRADWEDYLSEAATMPALERAENPIR